MAGTSVDHVKDLLRQLVKSSLGDARTAELLGDVRLRAFDAYVLRGQDGVPEHSTYRGRVYATRGGVDYFRPDGWVQVGVTAVDKDPDFIDIREWPIAYHGTDSSKLGPILEAGLRKPGELPSVQISHGQAGAGAAGAIYVSPSLWLASHPVYSTFLRLAPDHWVQFVFKVRVRPGTYQTQPSTLATNRHWPQDLKFDPNFEHNEALEWLVSDSSDVLVVGLMVRELGGAASPQVYGSLATSVVDAGATGAEYCWTDLLSKLLRSGGFVIDSGTLTVGQTVVEWQLEHFSRKREAYREGQCIQSATFPFRRLGLKGSLKFFPGGMGGGGADAVFSVHVEHEGTDAMPDTRSSTPLSLELAAGAFHTRWIIPGVEADTWYDTPLHEEFLRAAQAPGDAICFTLRGWSASGHVHSELVAADGGGGLRLGMRLKAKELDLTATGCNHHIYSESFDVFAPTTEGRFCKLRAHLVFYPRWSEPWSTWCGLALHLVAEGDHDDVQVAYELTIGSETAEFTKRVADSGAEHLSWPLLDAVQSGEVQLSALMKHCRLHEAG